MTEEREAKQRILEAAIRLFARQGYGGTGMRELAREADVNLAMINYYYGSKLELLEAVFDHYFDQHEATVRRLLALDEPPEVRLRMAVRELTALFRKNPDLVRVAFAELPYDMPEFADYKAQRIRDLIAPFILELMEQGQPLSPRPINPLVVGPTLLGALLFHFMMRPVLEKIFDFEFDDAYYELTVDQQADMILYGIFGHPPPEE
jgi:AcrR family transcriptional regulator